MTTEVLVPISSIPSIEYAVKELGYDMVTGSVEGDFIVCWFMIPDNGSLLSIGFIAGTHSMYSTLDTEIEKVVKKIFKKQ